EALSPLLHVIAVLIELEEAGLAAPRVDEHVPFRVGGDANPFAEVDVRRKLEEVRHRVVGDLRNVLGLGLRLRERRRGRDDCKRDDDANQSAALHANLRPTETVEYGRSEERRVGKECKCGWSP